RRSQARRVQRGSSSDVSPRSSLCVLCVPCGAFFFSAANAWRGCRRSQARRVQRGSSSDFSLVLLFVPCGALFLFATSALYDPRRRLQARLPPRIRELAAHDRVEDAPREGLALEGRPPGARREIGALDRHGLSLEDRERAGVARLEPAAAVGEITAGKANGVLARGDAETPEQRPR